MSVRVFVPGDSTACALGADQVAAALVEQARSRGLDIDLVRNGSRGLFWLEPLIEVETTAGRVAYGPVSVADVAELFDRDLLAGGEHPLALGPTEQIPYLQQQTRVNFARAGVIDPLNIDDYRRTGGFAGLDRALALSGQEIVAAIKTSGLRGRGGAAFPAGIKWQTVLDTAADQKYIVCNADEGDSGTFADRLLLEADPLQLVEGMTIAGLAVGATRGYIYVRSEYPRAFAVLRAAIALAREDGYLGPDVCGSGRAFELEARLGAGAYICGEETSLLESLEGRRGLVRAKPPLPAIQGLFGKPTVVNNVLTLASVAAILARGADWYRALGCGRSLGTLPMQLAGNIKHGGVVELPFGMSLRALIEDFGGGTASGRPVRAVQVGGPLGAYLSADELDLPLDYEAFAAQRAMLGHGGVVVFDDSVDMAEQARFAMEFCVAESCGKCTPCRIGSVRGVEVIDRIRADTQRADNLLLLKELCDTMEYGSLCAMGGLTPMPVRSAVEKFPEDFGA
ncbi:MAG: SLBB domain-containing protein [Gammaproteobacteria bacterium]|nr:SLBB domain-containing protein [Gammaproteobacteria bacterium]